jgi:hypothetical protein
LSESFEKTPSNAALGSAARPKNDYAALEATLFGLYGLCGTAEAVP